MRQPAATVATGVMLSLAAVALLVFVGGRVSEALRDEPAGPPTRATQAPQAAVTAAAPLARAAATASVAAPRAATVAPAPAVTATPLALALRGGVPLPSEPLGVNPLVAEVAALSDEQVRVALVEPFVTAGQELAPVVTLRGRPLWQLAPREQLWMRRSAEVLVATSEAYEEAEGRAQRLADPAPVRPFETAKYYRESNTGFARRAAYGVQLWPMPGKTRRLSRIDFLGPEEVTFSWELRRHTLLVVDAETKNPTEEIPGVARNLFELDYDIDGHLILGVGGRWLLDTRLAVRRLAAETR